VRGLGEVIAAHSGEARVAQVRLSQTEWAKIAPLFHRALHVAQPSRPVASALNSQLDTAGLSEAYLAGSPSVLMVDDFLSPEALAEPYRYCLESTVFFDVEHKGYSGAYLLDGFGSPLVAQLESELRAAFPRVLCRPALKHGWFYKYDDVANSAINIHADVAAVNFNLWLAPEDCWTAIRRVCSCTRRCRLPTGILRSLTLTRRRPK
jgi:hypothetical protein